MAPDPGKRLAFVFGRADNTFYAFERKNLETVNIEQAKVFIRDFFDFLSGRNPRLVKT